MKKDVRGRGRERSEKRVWKMRLREIVKRNRKKQACRDYDCVEDEENLEPDEHQLWKG